MTALILQARLDSSRLPGKALLPLGERPVIQALMAALKTVAADIHVLACAADSEAAFAPLARLEGFYIYGGPKEDVLERYCDVIRRYTPDRIIRATGDNPFVFADAAWAIHRESREASYGAYRNLPYGAGVESVDALALLRAEKEARLPDEREHVCPYLYTHPEIFSLHCPDAPPSLARPGLRITIDTKEDYQRALALNAALTRRFGNSPERYSGRAVIEAAIQSGLMERP
ncbi:MAG: spore coat protein [Spirochaetaceae bacterium]|jgi:spore coat polysaccharide biosynthesis protein SpsF|nr:spore coat protein [Spirochaetaceae bacterium]